MIRRHLSRKRQENERGFSTRNVSLNLIYRELKAQIYILYLSIYLSKIHAGPLLLFCFAVRCMMYGFGDEQVPFTESVDLLEDLVVEYITEMVRSLCSPRASHNYVMYQRMSQLMLWVIGTFT